MLWSILVMTVPGREQKLASLLSVLEPQATREVEILVLRDNIRRSIGTKRNALVSIANGEYVSFVDDDDMVDDRYVYRIGEALADRPDVVCFNAWVTGCPGPDRIAKFSNSYELDENYGDEYRRLPNHLCVWKKSLVLPYADQSRTEDAEWAHRMKRSGAAKTSVEVPAILYHYRYDQKDRIDRWK